MLKPIAPLHDDPPPPGWVIGPEPTPLAGLTATLRALGFEGNVVASDRVCDLPTGRDRPPWLILDMTAGAAPALATLASLRRAAPSTPLLAIVPADPPAQACVARAALVGGADDFCRQDAAPWEWQARLESLGRRGMPCAGPLQVGDLVLDLGSRSAQCGDNRLRLSARQFDLLHLLMRHAGEVLSPERIERALSLPPRARGSNVVEVHVHHLRRHIGPGRLSTLRGRGYVLHGVGSECN